MRSRYPTPARPHLMRAERGNPVRVRWRRLGVAGKLTVREAGFPGGNRTPRQRMPAGRKAAGKRERQCRSSSRMLAV